MDTLQDHMNIAAAGVQSVVSAAVKAGLSRDAAAVAAAIGVISYIRVHGMNEEAILKEARRAVPHRHQMEMLHTVQN